MAQTGKEQANTEDHSENQELDGSAVLGRGVKIVGESIAPGASQFIDGNLASGAVHLVGGLIARAALGPIGYLLVAANSYSKSVSDKNLFQHFSG